MLFYIFDDAAGCIRGKVTGIYAILIAANIAVWLWALAEFHDIPLLLGTAFFVKPIGKLYYNMTITLASVVAALGISGIETVGLIRDKFGLDGPPWRFVVTLSANFAFGRLFDRRVHCRELDRVLFGLQSKRP